MEFEDDENSSPSQQEEEYSMEMATTEYGNVVLAQGSNKTTGELVLSDSMLYFFKGDEESDDLGKEVASASWSDVVSVFASKKSLAIKFLLSGEQPASLVFKVSSLEVLEEVRNDVALRREKSSHLSVSASNNRRASNQEDELTQQQHGRNQSLSDNTKTPPFEAAPLKAPPQRPESLHETQSVGSSNDNLLPEGQGDKSNQPPSDNNPAPEAAPLLLVQPSLGSNMTTETEPTALVGSTNRQVGGTDDEEKNLTADTYSFMIASPILSAPFLLSIAVASLQSLTFVLLALSMMDGEDSNNVFKVPVNVSQPVRITQLVAMVLAMVATPSDIHSALDLAKDGFNRHYFANSFPDSTCCKFALSITLRLLLGFTGMILMFLLIVTAETVLDLLLNFTALEFVTLIDEGFFIFAKEGFIGKSCETQAFFIEQTTYRAHKQPFRRLRKYLIILLFLAAYFTGWGLVLKMQRNGEYLCSTIMIQFGDDLKPALGTFNGLYDMRINPSGIFQQPTRVDYVQRGYDEESGARFSYCTSLKSWTFRWPDKISANFTSNIDTSANDNIFNHSSSRGRRLKPKKSYSDGSGNDAGYDDIACAWEARSSETESFDLTETVESPWYVEDESGQEIILEPVYIACYDCQDSADECSGRGTCEDAVCSCDPGWAGPRCDLFEPCRTLSLDARFDGFPSFRPLSKDFELLEGDSVYYRPVYVGLGAGEDSRSIEVIFFTGRRWALTFVEGLLDIDISVLSDRNQTLAELREYFGTAFHAYWSSFSAEFLSEPMDYSRAGNAISPEALQWYFTERKEHDGASGVQRPNLALSVDAILLCSICNNSTNLCRYDGECIVGGLCQCAPGSNGKLCEDPPVGDAHCDPFFNTPEFDLDGGDCCDSTCVDGDFFCGAPTDTSFLDYGFPSCRLPGNEWRQHKDAIVGGEAQFMGERIAISASGNTLAISGNSQIAIYETQGSKWTMLTMLYIGEGDNQDDDGEVGQVEELFVSDFYSGVTKTPTVNVPVVLGFVYGYSWSPSESVHYYACSESGSGYRYECVEHAIGTANENSVAHHTFASTLAFAVSKAGGNAVSLIWNEDTKQHHVMFYWFAPNLSANLRSVWGDVQEESVDLWTMGLLDEALLKGSYGQGMRISDTGETFALMFSMFSGVNETIHNIHVSVFHRKQGVERLGEAIQVDDTVPDDSDFAVPDTWRYPRFSWSLSGDGKVLVFSNFVRHSLHVYEWSGNEWTTREAPPFLVGNGTIQDTFDVDISTDGTVLAYTNGSHTLTYEWNGERNSWAPLGQELPGDHAVALSRDASLMAVGLPLFEPEGENRLGGGVSYVYSRPVSKLCPENETLIRLSVGAQDPTVLFELSELNGETILKPPGMVGAVAEDVCLDLQQKCYLLTVDTPDEYEFAFYQAFTPLPYKQVHDAFEFDHTGAPLPSYGDRVDYLRSELDLFLVGKCDGVDATTVQPKPPFDLMWVLGTVYDITAQRLVSNEASWGFKTLPNQLWLMTALTRLDLSGCGLEGTIPTQVGLLTSLQHLDLEDNDLDGSLPNELFRLASLTYLSLSDNQLTGSLPELTSMTSLALGEIKLSLNQLDGSIPTILGGLPALTHLELQDNGLVGSLPTELGGLTTNSTERPVYMDLSNNQLQGPIVSQLGLIHTMEYLYLRGNSLSGSIPTEFGALGWLMALDLSENQLTGTVPELTATNIDELVLNDNQLTGIIPEGICSFPRLTSLIVDCYPDPFPVECTCDEKCFCW